MTSLRHVKHHLRSLKDIRAIMNSMKSLAYMEIHKLSRNVHAQRRVTEEIEIAAADLLQSHPEVLPPGVAPMRVWIVFGTERGFCGNLNRQLHASLIQERQGPDSDKEWVMFIGRKLRATLEGEMADDARLVLLDGAGVAEEAQSVLNGIVDQLGRLHGQAGPPAVSTIYFDSDGILRVRHLLPPFRELPADFTPQANPAVLNLSAAQLFMELVDHYLFSSLFEILYESLFNENQHRMKHLGDAVRHLDRETAQLSNRINALHQEQITEEIEVLLLSTTGGQARQ